MKKRLLPVILILFVVLLVVFTGCSAANDKADVNVSVAKALEMWQSKQAIIIDVRTRTEYNDGHIPDATLIPLSEIEKRQGEVPKDKKVLIICRSGSRSSQATQLLRDKGFTNVYNITGGMNEWRGPVIK